MELPEEVVKKAAGVLADRLPVLEYHHIRERGRWGIKHTQSRFELGYTHNTNTHDETNT